MFPPTHFSDFGSLVRRIVLGAVVGCTANTLLATAPGAPMRAPQQPAVDEPPPALLESGSGDVRFIAPGGDDAAPGTLAEPWGSFERAAGLRGGDTLVVRGGTYHVDRIELRMSGTPVSPVTIVNFPGEQPVFDGGFLQFRTAPNQDWELVDAARGIYRSVALFPNAGRVYGHLGTADGGWRLVPYEDLGPLQSTTEDYSDSPPYFYCGPGVHWHAADQRIYVRLQHSRYQQRMNLLTPADTDPRNTPLFLFPERSLVRLERAAHLVIDGIGFRHGGIVLEFLRGAHHITVRRCDLLGGRYETVVRQGVHDLLFDRLTVDGRFPRWVARSDVKRPELAPPAHLLQGAAIHMVGLVRRVEVHGSTFLRLFDAIDANDRTVGLHVHRNRFREIRDDALELGSGGHDYHVHDNLVTECVAGFSWLGSGAPPPGHVGTKYIHDNVLDTSALHLHGRDDPQSLLPPEWRGPNGDGMTTGRAFGSHETHLVSGPDPWRIYHNTIVLAADVDGRGGGQCYDLTPFDPRTPHVVLNNIIVQTANHCLAQGARAHDGSQVIEGNLYFRRFPGATRDLIEDVYDGVSWDDFVSLQHFLTSSHRALTRSYYPPGWDTFSVQGDPQLDADYQPSAAGPAATGAVDLTWTGWPGTGYRSWRGALPPR